MIGRAFVAAVAAVVLQGATPARDPENSTCPSSSDWGPAETMTLTPATRGGKRVLLAEGVIDPFLADRLRAAIEKDDTIEEIWLRSSGGDAEAGNEAGLVIRSFPGMLTRVPAGWTCFSACNFVFMGGDRRVIDPGGVFMVHMFTFTSDRGTISSSVKKGTEDTVGLIGEIEQASALLASQDNDFLIRMGVSRKLLTDVMYKQLATGGATGQGERYCLTLDEAVKYNVTNGMRTAD